MRSGGVSFPRSKKCQRKGRRESLAVARPELASDVLSKPESQVIRVHEGWDSHGEGERERERGEDE